MVLIKTAIFPLLFQCFTRALRDLASFYPLLIVSTVVINFPSVLLKFAIAFPFFSHCSLFIPNFRMKIALLTKFGQKLNFCTSHDMCVISSYRNCNFSIAFPLRDNGPTSEPQFYLASFYPLPILSTVFPRVSIFQAFYSNFPLLSHFFPLFYIIVSHFFHCFSHHFPLLSHFFPIVLCHIPSFFHCFSHHFPSFSPPFPFLSHCFISYSLIFSIVFLIIFPSIAISPSPPRRADQGGIDTPPSPNCHLVHKPKKLYLWPPFLPPNFPIFGQLGALCPQTPLTHFVRKKNFA